VGHLIKACPGTYLQATRQLLLLAKLVAVAMTVNTMLEQDRNTEHQINRLLMEVQMYLPTINLCIELVMEDWKVLQLAQE
jgi:hypothetical protein